MIGLAFADRFISVFLNVSMKKWKYPPMVIKFVPSQIVGPLSPPIIS